MDYNDEKMSSMR